nr:uncharacterized protein LOC108119872 [Drosophila bipectinata]
MLYITVCLRVVGALLTKTIVQKERFLLFCATLSLKRSCVCWLTKFLQAFELRSAKRINRLLANEVVWEYNVDGVQGKGALRKEENFFGVIIDSITAVGGIGPAEEQLRKALQLQKKRF